MNIYDDMKAAGVEIDSHESDLYVPVNASTTEILKRYPDIRASTFTDNITKTPWYDIPFQFSPFWEAKRRPEGPRWPPPRANSKKAYRCGCCEQVFHAETNHWGSIYACPLCKASARCICIEPAPEGYERPAVPTIKTRIHYYRFNMRLPEERRRWLYLQAALEDAGVTCYNAQRNRAEQLKETVEDITLEVNQLFKDQWSSTTSTVFDWYLGTDEGTPDIRAGHWLEITEEMKRLRNQTIACGFCGHQQRAVSRTHFHFGCLASEHLKESELSMLRWRRIDDNNDREALSSEERAWLVPLYRSRQIHGPAGQKQRSEILSNFEAATFHATAERDGMLWLLDRAIKLDNVIYYKHTGRFAFGWKTALSTAEQEELKTRLAGFPFPYDMK